MNVYVSCFGLIIMYEMVNTQFFFIAGGIEMKRA